MMMFASIQLSQRADRSLFPERLELRRVACFSRHRYTLDRNVMFEVLSSDKRVSSGSKVMVIDFDLVTNLDSINGEVSGLLKTNGQMGLWICRNL